MKRNLKAIFLGTVGACAFALSSAFGANDAEAMQYIDLSKQGYVQLSDETKIELPISMDGKAQKIRFFKIVGAETSKLMQATYGPGRMPIVFINEAALSLSPQHFRFFLEHELAHHELGHVARTFMPLVGQETIEDRKKEIRGFEFEADCHAVKGMKLQGVLKSDEINEVFQQAKEKGSVVHPSRGERIEKALSCFDQVEGPVLAQR